MPYTVIPFTEPMPGDVPPMPPGLTPREREELEKKNIAENNAEWDAWRERRNAHIDEQRRLRDLAEEEDSEDESPALYAGDGKNTERRASVSAAPCARQRRPKYVTRVLLVALSHPTACFRDRPAALAGSGKADTRRCAISIYCAFVY
jgi:hypothetical protein